MHIPDRLERLMVKWKLIEYVTICQFSDNCCLKQHQRRPVELEPLEEVMRCLDLTNAAVDRYLKSWDGQP